MRQTKIKETSGKEKNCFVIMPFSITSNARHTESYWTFFFEDFLRPSIENLGYRCTRSAAMPSNIIKNIMGDLYESDIVLAVLTDFNPNVWYELGVRHTFRNGTIMIIEKGQRLPFDIQHYGVIQYEDSLFGRSNFEKELKNFIREIESAKKLDSPVREFLNGNPVKTVLAAPNAGNSPLNFISALELTQKRMLVVGQNLHTLTQLQFKEAAFETLRSKKIDLQFLLCDPQNEYTVQATQDFVGHTFSEDLKESLLYFKKWQEEADFELENGRLKGRLEIRLSRRIGNLSLTFIDPALKSGMLEINPGAFDSTSINRPRFILTQVDHPDMFNNYWSAYDQIYRTGNSRSIMS